MTRNVVMAASLLYLFLGLLQFKVIPSCEPSSYLSHANDFKSLVLNNDIFVDKTLLIEEFMELLRCSFIPLIVRPRGWGKSTNIDMLKRFYEIEVDERGNLLAPNKTINDKLFLGGELDVGLATPKKLEPLKISYVPRAVGFLGRMPVISLNMENVTGTCYAQIEQNIKSRIVQTFQRHRYLTEANHSMVLYQSKPFSDYLDGNFSTDDLQKSLIVLSGKLYNFFNRRKVIILIDDYDAPLINAHLEFGDNRSAYDKLVNLLDSMYKFALKGNPYLHKGMVTATLRMSFDTALKPIASLDNLEVCSFFYRRFYRYFGFTRSEMKDMLEKVPSRSIADLEQMNSWYGGYGGVHEEIYFNSGLVMRFLSNNSSSAYYEQSTNVESNPLIDKIFAIDKLQPKIQSLISGQRLNLNYIFPMMRLRWEEFDELVVLLYCGYLNKTNDIVAPRVAIPNKHVLRIYELNVLKWMVKKFQTDSAQFYSFAGLLTDNNTTNMDQFGQTLSKYFSHAAKLIKSGDKQSKAVYNGLTIALRAALWSTHENTDNGQNDGFILLPRPQRSDTAIIFKYRVIKEMKQLAHEASAVLSEINATRNDTDFSIYPNIRTVKKIAAAFCEENATIEDQLENIAKRDASDAI